MGRFLPAGDPVSAAATPGRPQPGGELVYGMSSKFDTLDPNVTTFSQVERIANLVFDPLIRESKPGVFVPALG